MHAASDALQPRRAHAEFHARSNQAGIGAAVVLNRYQDGHRLWDCLVTDGREWHYVRVLGPDAGPYPNLSPEDIERGVERFAAAAPAQNRMLRLLNANPLHVDAAGEVRD
jgi:hypothetical protein